MSKHLARDSAVWNRLMYGCSRTPSPVNLKSFSEKSEYGPEYGSEYDSDSEEYVVPRRKNPTFSRTNILLLAVTVIFLLFQFLRFLSGDSTSVLEIPELPNSGRFYSFVDSGSYGIKSKKPKEVLSVAYPLNPEEKYGAPVYSEVLVNHTFASWGNPKLVAFKPPKKEFNHVVLTLKTTVDGVQYDRLAHLYVGGAEIWRTSTIEPGARNVFSMFQKDVSPYANLFKERTNVLFQLDNLVNLWLTGKFHIELTAHFYQLTYFHSENVAVDYQENLADQYKIYDTRKPADHVYALVEKKSAADTPLVYLPSLKFVAKLPQVSTNTTRLKLSTFVSGNANDEFWYSNVLDKYKDIFEKDGHSMLGHGPARFLNIYVDGIKVATQVPQPFIFTGGYSPALWNPVVATDTFDLPSVDLDISGLLPLLWKSGDHELSFTVDNGLDELEGGSSGVGQNWILSANLLAYENSNVAESSGAVVHIGDGAEGNSFGVSPPYTGTLLQVVDGIFQGQLTSELVFKLKDGSVVNNTVNTFTKGEISNVQLYSHNGDTVGIVHVGHSSKSFLVTNNVNGETVHQTNISLSYPLVISLSETNVKGGVDLDFKVVNTKITTLDINGQRVMEEACAQNGTSLFHIRSNGNTGSGMLLTHFKAQIHGPKHVLQYERVVDSADGEVVRDVEEYKDIDEEEEKTFSKKIEEMGVKSGRGRGKHMKHEKLGKHRKHGKHGKHGKLRGKTQSLPDGIQYLPGQKLNKCTCSGKDQPSGKHGKDKVHGKHHKELEHKDCHGESKYHGTHHHEMTHHGKHYDDSKHAKMGKHGMNGPAMKGGKHMEGHGKHGYTSNHHEKASLAANDMLAATSWSFCGWIIEICEQFWRAIFILMGFW